MGEKHLDFINGEVGFRRGGILVDVEPVEPGFPLIIRRGPVSVVVAHEHLDEGTLAPPRGPHEAPVRLESLDVRGPIPREVVLPRHFGPLGPVVDQIGRAGAAISGRAALAAPAAPQPAALAGTTSAAGAATGNLGDNTASKRHATHGAFDGARLLDARA
eukprot:scaffold72184_cov61-Phaeocystis_antarctica.AAC.3